MNELGWWGIPLALLAGAIRVSTPFIFVSLGECLTEKSGRINLGLEGNLVLGAMTGYAISYQTGSPWLGVLAAALVGGCLGMLHALTCSLPRVNDIAVGISLMLLGIGLAFFFGKPYIQPSAPQLPSISLGFWSNSSAIKSALNINVLFFVGLILAPLLAYMLKTTRWGLVLRMVGDNADAARAIGYSVNTVRLVATAVGGAFAGVGGSFLSLYYPGSWSEGLSSGQGITAVALVIFARWRPMLCLAASLLFGATGALGPALQAVGITGGYYLFNAAPYFLTLFILILASSKTKTLKGTPSELAMQR
jgi:general nucleoside transport system permease protein